MYSHLARTLTEEFAEAYGLIEFEYIQSTGLIQGELHCRFQTPQGTAYIQFSIFRAVRLYLGRVVDDHTMYTAHLADRGNTLNRRPVDVQLKLRQLDIDKKIFCYSQNESKDLQKYKQLE